MDLDPDTRLPLAGQDTDGSYNGIPPPLCQSAIFPPLRVNSQDSASLDLACTHWGAEIQLLTPDLFPVLVSLLELFFNLLDAVSELSGPLEL